jgi:endoglucanase
MKGILIMNGFIMLAVLSFAQQVSTSIQLNQLGFYPLANKIAVVTGDIKAAEFYIIAADKKDTVFTGKLSAQRQSKNSSTKTKIADFSSLQKKGRFTVVVPGVGDSYVFEISNFINYPLAIASLKGFYYQRVSMPLVEQFAGKWARAAGHADTAVLIHPSAASKNKPAGKIISSPGGWYDAGDYNKYIVNSGITMGTLLSAYEDFYFHFDTLRTNIPESNDAVPDVLNEIIYNLRWMLTMQDADDGGVYHKCTNAAFDAMVMPGVTKEPRYAVQKGTAATLDFTAVTAQAARVLSKFKSQLPGLSDSCLKAAEYAWQWAVHKPNVEYDQDAFNKNMQPAITTGEYGDSKFADEWFWAAAELYVTTKQSKYLDALNKERSDVYSLPSWANVGMLGVYSLIRFEPSLPGTSKLTADLKKKVIHFADTLIQNVYDNAFNTVMGRSPKDFVWGSSAVAANQGISLVNAYLITKDKKYIDQALGNLDYLSGRNATGYCFITGLGSKSPMHPHHRPSVADGITEPVPGLLPVGQTRECRINANILSPRPKQPLLMMIAPMHLMKLLSTGMLP